MGNIIRSFVREYKPELQVVFWPSIVFTSVTFAVYFYLCWNVREKESEEDKKKGPLGPTRDEKSALRKLYDDGQRYEAAGDPKQALSCYLGAIHGINQCYDGLTTFPDILIDCIKRVTALCKASGEYDMALQFLQAEKFLYEHALVNNTMSSKPGAGDPASSASGSDVFESRASALEQISEVMLKEGKTEMAVSYASKALQVRQQSSADEASADMNQFLKAYAELGRETYKKNLQWYQKVQDDTDKLADMVDEMNFEAEEVRKLQEDYHNNSNGATTTTESDKLKAE